MSLSSIDAACGQCTGVWEGASVSHGGDPTAWSETCIVFWPAPPDRTIAQRVTLASCVYVRLVSGSICHVWDANIGTVRRRGTLGQGAIDQSGSPCERASESA